ncbi:MAG: mannose-1-phosphate guanylyltransferase [Myxococcales bacterium]|nr:mannose-1-phosphate guanylyltransferase [Myxococcales bacterium]
MLYAVVMAGGSGTRFWPLSRKARPKQFLAIGTRRPLLVETIERLAPLVPRERVKIVAGESHTGAIREACPELPPSALVIEPCARNTAPCVGLAAVHVAREDPDAVMAVLPADHHIGDGPGFRRLVLAAAERARAGEIVTLGIRPTRPETGYGYIHYDRKDTALTHDGVEVCVVNRFVEKPPRAVAEGYLAHGGYLWNSGMFFFTARRILDDIARLLPSLSTALQRIEAAIGRPDYDQVLAHEYNALQSVSLDYGIMEHAERVRVVPAEIGWNDVGHWAALGDFAESDAQDNIAQGHSVLVDAHRTTIHAEPGITVAAVGTTDLVVVATGDAVLVCDRERAQEVRKVVQALKKAGREDLL